MNNFKEKYDKEKALIKWIKANILGRLAMLPVGTQKQSPMWSKDCLIVEFVAPTERQYSKV